MTILRVSLAGDPLPATAKQDLAARLIETFAEVELGHPAPELHGAFVVHLESLEPGSLWLGPRQMVEAGPSGRAVVISAQVMAGPWDRETKALLFRRIEAVVREVAAMPRAGRGEDFWMTLVEVPDGGWSVGGQPISIGRLSPIFAADRRSRIREYLKGAEAARLEPAPEPPPRLD